MTTTRYSKFSTQWFHLGVDPDSPLLVIESPTGTGTSTSLTEVLIAYAGIHSFPSNAGEGECRIVIGPLDSVEESFGFTEYGYAALYSRFSPGGSLFNTITFSLVGTDSYETVRYCIHGQGAGTATDSLDTHVNFRQGLNHVDTCGDVYMGGILVFLPPNPGDYNNLFGVPIPCCTDAPTPQPSGPRVPETLKLTIRHPDIGVPGPCSCLDGVYVISWKGGYLWEATSTCFGERVVLTVGCVTFLDIFGDTQHGFILRIKCGDDPPIFSAVSSGSCETVDSTVDHPFKHVEILWGGTIEIPSGTKCCPILGSGSGSLGFNNNYGWSVTIL